MAWLFDDPSQRVYALHGQTGDYFHTPQLRELDLSTWLLAAFQAHGYRRVLFYSPRKKLHLLDAASARLCQMGETTTPPPVAPDTPAPAPTRATPLKAGPLGMARLPRTRRRCGPAPPPAAPDEGLRWDFGAMSDAQAISALDRLLCEELPTALVFQNGEDLFNALDADAVRHWDHILGDWCGTRLPANSRNLAVILFRDEIRLQADRLPRLRAHLFAGDSALPRANRAFRIGAARQDEVAALLHRLRLRGELRWTPAQIAQHSLALAQRLVPDDATASIQSLGSLAHAVRAMTAPPSADQAPWQQLRAAPGLAARVETRLRQLIDNARQQRARHAPPPSAPGPLDIARLGPPSQPAADNLANPHLALLGSPGTGKTTLARLVARIYRDEGLLDSGHLVEVRASDLIEEHIGGTAKRTAEMIARALGGVLFIDEAYSLASNSFGAEAVAELVQAMTQYNGQFAVIVAGYTREITDFIDGPETNPGLRRRFPEANRWELTNYDPTELYAIFTHLLARAERTLDAALGAALPAAFAHWHRNQDPERFGNAGEVKNLVESLSRVAGSRQHIETQDFAALSGWRQWLGLQSLPSVEELLRPLDSLIGLAPVKSALRELADTLAVAQRRGKTALTPGHYVFSGNPGTGKTTVARRMGEMLHALGLLARGHVVEVKREDLVGRFQGEAETNTKARINDALNGILFIDEAYQLAADEHDSYGRRALETLLANMENERHRLCVILAGYPEEMEQLLATNPGFQRRIEQRIHFPDYSTEELLAIAQGQLTAQGYHLSADATAVLTAHLQRWEPRRGQRGFGNAGEAGNLVRTIIARQAGRLRPQLDASLTDDELNGILPEDIPT